MYVVVGLGNPGRRYASTRHNVGFMVIEQLARRWNVEMTPAGADLRVGHGRFASAPVTLVEPQLYMNMSGEALSALPADPAAEWIVAYDDLDLPCGQLRIRRGGGSGGHRGIASIVAHRGADFIRVRVGIGRPGGDQDAVDYVLSPFQPAERDALEAALARAAEAVETVIREGVVVAMNRFNQRVQGPTRDD